MSLIQERLRSKTVHQTEQTTFCLRDYWNMKTCNFKQNKEKKMKKCQSPGSVENKNICTLKVQSSL